LNLCDYYHQILGTTICKHGFTEAWRCPDEAGLITTYVPGNACFGFTPRPARDFDDLCFHISVLSAIQAAAASRRWGENKIKSRFCVEDSKFSP
jgi:hypothetical protein